MANASILGQMKTLTSKLYNFRLNLLLSPAKTEIILQQQGVLEQDDQVVQSDGSLADLYTFSGQAGQQIRIMLESSEFDSYLILLDPDLNKISENDDANQNALNAELVITLPKSGTYSVIVNGHDRSDQGRYSLIENGCCHF